MRTKLLCLFVGLLFSIVAKAQPPKWTSGFGKDEDDFARGIVVDKAGNSYVIGTFSRMITIDGVSHQQIGGDTLYLWPVNAFVVKYNTFGHVVWFKQITGKVGDNFNTYYGPQQIAIDENANIYVTGVCGDSAAIDNNSLNLPGQSHHYLFKLDSAGSFKWSKLIHSTNSTSLTIQMGVNQSTDGVALGILYNDSIYFGNQLQTTSNSYQTLCIARFDSSGNWYSNANINTPVVNGQNSFAVLKSMNMDNNGELILSGYFKGEMHFNNTSIYDTTGIESMFIAKLDLQYNLLFNHNLNVDEQIVNSWPYDDNNFHPVTIDGNDNIYCMSTFKSDTLWINGAPLVRVNNDHDNCLLKINSTGTIDWFKQINSGIVTSTRFNSIFSGGSLINLIGEKSDSLLYDGTSIGGNDEMYLLTLDTAGNFYHISTNDWDSASYCHGGCDAFGSMYLISSNNNGTFANYKIMGSLVNSNGKSDGCVFKLDPTFVNIQTIKNQSDVSVFPNPFSGICYLETTSLNSDVNVRVYNVLNQQVYSRELKLNSAQTALDLSMLDPALIH